MPPYRIMTFDGGGVKGSLMATLVKRISDRYPTLLEQVDLYAGTSTGSVVALTLASGFNADKLVDFYSQENLRSAFSPSRFNWFRPKYSNTNFRSLLESHFPGNPKLGDLKKHNLVAPTFKLDSLQKHDWCPVFTHNFPGSHHLEELVVDVALRSAAAPTVFPSHQGHIDGGMVANNPAPWQSHGPWAQATATGVGDIRCCPWEPVDTYNLVTIPKAGASCSGCSIPFVNRRTLC